jgi:hypothetical protein
MPRSDGSGLTKSNAQEWAHYIGYTLITVRQCRTNIDVTVAGPGDREAGTNDHFHASRGTS